MQSPRDDRGDSVEPYKPIGEVSGATGTRCGVPVEVHTMGLPVHQPARASNFEEDTESPFGSDITSFNRVIEDQPQGLREQTLEYMVSGNPV